jgi:N-acetylglutamate synthase-like GNAT family acetyltransferase
VLIRRARAKEAAALTALAFRSKAFWGYDKAFLEASGPDLTVEDELVRSGRVFVAERDRTIAGFASLGGEPPRLELVQLFVEPDFIGSGVGRGLVDHAVAEARRLGAVELVVESDPNAEGFYGAMGGERVGTVPSIVDPERQLPLLRLKL